MRQNAFEKNYLGKMLLEQVIKFEFREPGPPKTGCFHDKTKIFPAILRVNYYSAYC